MSQHKEYVRFYDDRIRAHRQTHAAETLRDKLTQPVTVATGIVLLLVAIFALPGQFPIIEHILALITEAIWDGLVYVFPQSILDALDKPEPPNENSPPMTVLPQNTHAAKSDAMRRVLGLNASGGMMAHVMRARTRAFSATGNALGFKADNNRPPGLGNMDYSCYQNSILQSLASLKPLPEYLSNCIRIAEETGEDKALAQTLKTLMADLTDGNNNGATIWTPYLLKSMSSIQQQDASEYFSKVLDDIDKGVSKAVKATNPRFRLDGAREKGSSTMSLQNDDDSGYESSRSDVPMAAETRKLRNPLEGLTAQRVACTSCGYTEGFSLTTFNCLMLSLDERNRYNLYERLDSFSDIEFLDGVHCPRCTLLKAQRLLTRLVSVLEEKNSTPEQMAEPKRRLDAVELALEEEDFDDKTLSDNCKITAQSKVNTNKTKQVVIARPPPSLAIHINRSVFNRTTFDLYKNSAPVTFPTTLDLGPWCLGSTGRDAIKSGEGISGADLEDIMNQEQWLSEPTKSMIAGSNKTSRISGPIYELRAAVTHAGRHENGHYICYRRHPYASKPSSKKEEDAAEEDGIANEKDQKLSPDPEENIELAEMRGNDANSEEMTYEDEGDWWRLSDHNVSRVHEDDVLNLSPGVFMLFYDCVDPEMVLEPELDRPEEALSEEGKTTMETAELLTDTDATDTDVHDTEDSGTVVSLDTAATDEPSPSEDAKESVTENAQSAMPTALDPKV